MRIIRTARSAPQDALPSAGCGVTRHETLRDVKDRLRTISMHPIHITFTRHPVFEILTVDEPLTAAELVLSIVVSRPRIRRVQPIAEAIEN